MLATRAGQEVAGPFDRLSGLTPAPIVHDRAPGRSRWLRYPNPGAAFLTSLGCNIWPNLLLGSIFGTTSNDPRAIPDQNLHCCARLPAIRVKVIFLIYAKNMAALARVAYRRTRKRIFEWRSLRVVLPGRPRA